MAQCATEGVVQLCLRPRHFLRNRVDEWDLTRPISARLKSVQSYLGEQFRQLADRRAIPLKLALL